MMFTKKGFQFLPLFLLLGGVCLVAQAVASPNNDDPKNLNKDSGAGKIRSVVLYRNQALIGREVTIPKSKNGDGLSGQFIVEDLPHTVLPETLFAEGGDKIQIQTVRYMATAISLEANPKIKKLKDELQNLSDEIASQQSTLAFNKQRLEYLGHMEGFVSNTGKVELSKGVLNAETLERMFKFTTEERSRMVKQDLEVKKSIAKLNKDVQFVKRKLAEISTKDSKMVRQAVIFYTRDKNESANIRLSYLVNQCGWSPHYTVRAFENKETLDLRYNGMIRQFTGEDWNQVNLTLSTASPAMSAASPGLAPFKINLTRNPSAPPVRQGRGGGLVPGNSSQHFANEMNQQQIQSILNEQRSQIVANRNAVNYLGNLKSSWNINQSANKLSEIAMNWDADNVEAMYSQAIQSEETLSLSYELPSDVSLSSRSGQQMVTISKSSLKRDLYYVATPVLTRQVFREAEVKNTSKQDFLSGPVNVYLDNDYVGQAEMATVARGQTFVVGLGTDPQIHASRRLVSREQKTQGGNRVIDLKYVTVLENFKQKNVPVRIFDRTPTSQSSDQIKISTHEMKTALSKDSNYQKIEKPTGILRWDIDLAGGASGDKSLEIPFGYTIELDRNYRVTTTEKDNNGLQQFDKLQRKRSRK